MRRPFLPRDKEEIKEVIMANSFLIYDLTFLIAFTLFVIIFLYKRRMNLQRQGLLFLYRTQVGVRFIDKFSKKYSSILKPLQYIIILSGYILMFAMVWMLAQFSWIYLKSPVAAKALRIPVLLPLVPYLPDIFKLDFLPSFNFTYWIIIIAIIAIPHEFAHGIFARLNNIKIHSTGFGFLGPFLAAFVEQDDKQMNKAPKFAQLSVLAAGTFANVIFTVIFGLLFWLFFISTFTQAGVLFNAYSSSQITIADISQLNGISISSPEQIPPLLNESLAEIFVNGKKYFANPGSLKLAIENKIPGIQVFDDTPAFNARLAGAISEINGEKITSFNQISAALQSHKPGDTLEIKTLYQESVRKNNVEERSYTIQLAEKEGKPFLGIGVSSPRSTGPMGVIFSLISEIKDPLIFYQSSLGTFGWFIYFFLWWAVLILVSVALVNMLPVGIFDGGRFFYLTIWALTGSEKIGRNTFKISTWLILLLVLAMMIKWALIFV